MRAMLSSWSLRFVSASWSSPSSLKGGIFLQVKERAYPWHALPQLGINGPIQEVKEVDGYIGPPTADCTSKQGKKRGGGESSFSVANRKACRIDFSPDQQTAMQIYDHGKEILYVWRTLTIN